MKIHLDMTGKELARPDFAMLRAGLAAAQASTPTATANDRAHAPQDFAEALIRLFGDRAEGVTETRSLHGRFNPVTIHTDDGDEIQK